MGRKIKLIGVLCIISMFLFTNLYAANYKLNDVTIKTLPASTDEFIELRDKISKTPEGGAAILIISLIVYSQDPKLGEKFLVLAVDKSTLTTGNVYKGYALPKSRMDLVKKQLSYQNYLPNSYIEGAEPDNSYKLPDSNYTMHFSYNSYSGDMEKGPFKVFVVCSGASSPRPITLKINNKGIWKALEWSSVIVGIMKTESENNDEL